MAYIKDLKRIIGELDMGTRGRSKREVVAGYKNILIDYYKRKRFACTTELGLCRRGKRRADFIAMNMKNEFVIVECKSCLADFRSDHKWQDYLKYCNKFYFCVDQKLYEKIKEELPKEVGCFVGSTVVKPAKTRPMDPQIQMQLLTRLAYRNSEY